jgi:hypothetical protein
LNNETGYVTLVKSEKKGEKWVRKKGQVKKKGQDPFSLIRVFSADKCQRRWQRSCPADKNKTLTNPALIVVERDRLESRVRQEHQAGQISVTSVSLRRDSAKGFVFSVGKKTA